MVKIKQGAGGPVYQTGLTAAKRTETDANETTTDQFLNLSPEKQSLKNSVIPIKDIIIKQERYRKEFGDIDTLADNISNLGLLQPIVISKNNELIDGQRRILAYQKLGNTEIPCFKVNLEKIVLGEFSANHYRKDWTYSEIVAIKRAIEPYERMKAKERMLSGKPSVNLTRGRSIDSVGKIVGASRNTIKKAEEIVTAAEQTPERYQPLLDKIDSKQLSVDKAYNKLNKEKKREELKSIKTNIELPPENCKLFCNDFTKIDSETIPDNSIDLIYTDPPYGEQYLYIYEYLARLAERVLKPGGSLVFYAGHIILDEVFNIFYRHKTDLKYWWPIAVKHNGAKQRVHARFVFAEWKPLIWYIKGQKPTNILDTMFDLIESSPPDKSLHEWAQSKEEPEHIIRYLTVENQIVLDPMMGSGTTGIAALKLNRKFIGIEIDQEHFEIGKNRIASSTTTISTSFLAAEIENNQSGLDPL
jgi:DNA modification methylase